MVYPQRLLNDDESVTVDLHPHWWFLAGPVCLIVVAIVGGIVTLRATDPDTTVRTTAVWASLGAIAVSACWLVVRYLRWTTTHFVITDRRIIFRTGVLSKHGVEIPLDRVSAVHFSQGLIERLVGAGDLLVESGSESGQQRFTDIRQPDRVQRMIHAGMDQRRRTAGGIETADIAGQLEKLEMMLERGTLTREEFDRQKQRLLGW